MSDDLKYQRLRDAFRTVGHSTVISGIALVQAHGPNESYVNHHKKSTARALGMYLLEHGLINFVIMGTADQVDPDARELKAYVRVLPPTDPDVTARETELDEARAEGREQVLAEFAEEANQMKNLDMYGPVIGNALSHSVEQLRRRKW